MIERMKKDSLSWSSHMHQWTTVDRWYMFPYLHAQERRHPQLGGIAVFNLFLGWTILGWIVALIWASSQTEARVRYPAVTVPQKSRTSQRDLY